MKTTKRLFSLFLLLAMVASLFSGVAYASEEFDAPDVMEPVTEEVTEDPVPEEVTEEEAPLTSGDEALVPVAEEAPAEEEAPEPDALPEEAEEATEEEEAPAEDGEQEKIFYRTPVYKTDDASSGIACWDRPGSVIYTVVTAENTTWGTAGETTWYVVNSDVTITSGITVNGNVILILCNGVTLTVAGNDGCAGISVTGSNTLTICAGSFSDTIDGTGELKAEGGANAAGIGGGNGGDGSNITINGGTVTATGGANAAGIGGGNGGSGSNITINGGTVTATGNNEDGYRGGAGIGGGYGYYDDDDGNYRGGNGSNITINGGTVTAKGGNYGAGIGGGENGSGSSITINGGKVTATGGNYGGAGIGGGSNSYGSYITINAGTVTATGGREGGAGIGGGSFSYGSNITTNGGTVRAEGGGYCYEGGYFYLGAGIGGGCGADTASYSRNIHITGGEVTATGGSATDYSAVTRSANGIGVGLYYNEYDTQTYATEAVDVTVSTSLVLKAGDTYPPTTVVSNEDNDDLAGSLSGKQYVTIKPMLLVAKIGSIEYATVQAAINTVTNDTETIITMIANSTENITVAAGQNITLDLNGYVLQGDGTDSVITNNGILTIEDGNPNAEHKFVTTSSSPWVWDETDGDTVVKGGCITGGVGYEKTGYVSKGGGITVLSGSVTMKGGNIVGNTSPIDGGGVRNLDTFTMEKGTITGNAVTGESTTGGGVYNEEGTFTMKGGTIGNNTSTGNGAGVFNKDTFSMTGGSITNNDTSGTGGGVYNEATFTMTGGRISDNTADVYAGGVDQSGTMTVGGKAVIKDNTSDIYGTDNLYLVKGKYVSIAEGNDAPVEGMYIGVRFPTEKLTGRVTEASSADYQSYFHSDDTNYDAHNDTVNSNQFVYIGNALLVEKNEAYNTVANAILKAGECGYKSAEIRMLADSTEYVSQWGTCEEFTLDLNGHVLMSTKNGLSVITVNSGIKLTIEDNNPTATHSGVYADLPAGGVITGAISGSIFTKVGRGITNNGELCLYGGTVTGNKGKTCGGVYNAGTMTVGGTAKITGNTNGNLYLISDKEVGIGSDKYAPAAGMCIGVTMANGMGKFTLDDSADVDDVQYFFSDNAAYCVAYKDSALYLITDPAVTFAANLTLSESIAVNIYIKNTTDVGKFTVTADGTTLTGTAGTDCIRYTMENLNAAELGNSVHYVVSYTDDTGTYQIKSFDYSAATYCDNMIAKDGSSEKLKNLCNAVLLYGAAAQEYTGKTNTLYTAENYDDKLKTITGLPGEGSMTKDASYGVGVAMSLDSKLNMKLTLTDGTGVGSFTDTSTMVGFTVGENGYYLNGVTIANETGKSSVTVAGIQPTQMDTTLTLYYRADGDVKTRAGSANGLVTFSANQYLKAIYDSDSSTEMTKLQKLCLALYNYGVMAKAYTAE